MYKLLIIYIFICILLYKKFSYQEKNVKFIANIDYKMCIAR